MAETPDSAIHDFVKDPLTFLNPRKDSSGTSTSRTVSSFDVLGRASFPVGIPTRGYFKFILDYTDPTKRTFEVKYHGPEAGMDTAWAYFLGYNAGGQTSRKPAFIDIPVAAPENTLLFTGMLTGCSVIVTTLNDSTYRVFHDVRVNSSLFYDNVAMAIDYNDYSTSTGHSTGNVDAACVLMQYREGRWNMFGQLQALRGVGKQHVVRALNDTPIIASQPGLYNAEHARAVFDGRRTTTLQKLMHVAFELLHVPLKDIYTIAPDGDFEKNKISMENAAVSRSQKIRELVKKALGGMTIVGEADTQLRDTLKQRNTLIRKLVNTSIDDTTSFDFTYLWIKEREATSFRQVVITDGQLQAPLGNTAGERFTDQQLNALLAGDPSFAQGYRDPDNVHIPNFSSDMTSSEMITLSDTTPDLSQIRFGALVHYIRNAHGREFKESVWSQTNKILQMFQDAGGSTKPMPQDLILNAVPDELGGRCYPLVRAMSVALAQSDFAVDQLGIKLLALSPSSESDLMSAEIFRRCLKDLHASYPAIEASTVLGEADLGSVVNRLGVEDGKSRIFALNTATHAMLLGMTNRSGIISYHFYDPNFAITTFPSKEKLFEVTEKFFVEYGFADVYGAAGDPSSGPVFTVIQLDTEKMARIGFDFRLTVADFCEPEALIETIDIKAASEVNLPDAARFTENRALSAGADLLQASELAEAWRDATARLEKSVGLGKHWMPILETLEDVDRGGFHVQFVNLEDPRETRWISSEDPEIKEFKTYLDARLEALRKAYRFEGGTFVKDIDATDAEAMDGLNAMFVVKTLIEHFSGRKDSSQGNGATDANLAMALKVQSYLSLTQLGQQTLGDVVKMVQLTQTILKSEEAAQSSLSSVLRGFGRVSEGVGIVLGAFNVAFDIYILANAQNENQKAVYGTQLAFDSASLLAGIGSAGAGFVGASSVAAVLGGVTVILGGLAVGVGALAVAYGQVAEHADTVGRYFGDTDAAYKAGGYKYDEKNKILVPLVGAVISKLNMAGDVEFDSQFIYRTHHGSTGSGKSNYFFWAGDFPSIVWDKSQAINVRDRIGAPSSGKLPNTTDYLAVILPATPKSFISYTYGSLPFATTRHDYGFDVVRRLEGDYRFDYDFYIFPSEYIITSISHEYVETHVEVLLWQRSMRIQVPKLPDNMHGFLKYTLNGVGTDYTIGLMAGVGMTLSSDFDTHWILDCRDLGDDTITVEADGVTLGEVQVKFTNQALLGGVLAIKKNAEVVQLDFDKHLAFPVEEDGARFPGGNEKLLAHLNDLNDQHLLRGTFITVENYTTPSGKAVGRAFYDVSKRCMLYTVDMPAELTKTVELGGITADGVYFFNKEYTFIWRVDPATGSCLAKYKALYPSPKRTIARVWQEDGYVHADFQHEFNSMGVIWYQDLCYVLEADSMKLVSMVANTYTLQELNTLGAWAYPPESLLGAYAPDDNYQFSLPIDSLPGAGIEATVASQMLMVYGQDDNNIPYRFWIRFTDGAIIKPNFKPQPDLVLAGIIIEPVGNVEEFCFYSLKDQYIALQTGTGTNTSEPIAVTVPPEFGALANVLCVNNMLFVVTKSGYVLRMTSQGTLFMEAVNEFWFSQFKDRASGSNPWWTVLKNIAESHGATTVTILGLHDADHKVVPAWFCNGSIVVVSSLLHDQQLQIAGLTKSAGAAWLCHWETEKSGHLYSQPLLSDDHLRDVLSATTPDVASEKIPAATKLLETHPFKMVVMTNNGIQYTTTDGVIFVVLSKDSITLQGVDNIWRQQHSGNLEAELSKLAKEWDHGEVILIGLEPTAPAAWYLVRAEKVVSVAADLNIKWSDNPRWLGTDLSGTTGYFYLPSAGLIYSIKVESAVSKLDVVGHDLTMAVRLADLVVFARRTASPAFDFRLFPLSDARYAMLSQIADRGASYIIPSASAAYYEAHVVQWKASAANAGSVQLDYGLTGEREVDAGALLAQKIGDDLVFTDASNGHSLTIRKAFGNDPTYANVNAQFPGSLNINSARVRSAQSWLQGVAKLELPPVVTLKIIQYYLENVHS